MILPALLAQVLGRESQTQIRPRVPESEGMAQYWMMTSPDADRCRTWRMCAVSIYGQRKLPPPYPRTGGESFTSISSTYVQIARKCGADTIRAWDGPPCFMSRVPVHDGVDAVMDYLFLEESVMF